MVECSLQKDKIYMHLIEREQQEIDSAFALLRDTLAETDKDRIEVNLGRLDLINGKGIHKLLLATEYAESLHKKLTFRVSKDVRNILSFTGMDIFINVV